MAIAEWRRLNVRPELVNLAHSLVISVALDNLIAHSPDLSGGGQAVLGALGQHKGSEELVDFETRTGAERLEAAMQKLAERMPLFRTRALIRSRLQLEALALVQSRLHISLAQASPIPQSAYRASLAILELSLRYASSKEIHVILYLCPIRPASPASASPSDVVKIRRDVKRLCETYGVKCVDYSDLIPLPLWSNYNGVPSTAAQRDFVHFTAEGHYMLAARLMHDTSSDLIGWTRTASRQGP